MGSFWDTCSETYLKKFEYKRGEPSRKYIIEALKNGDTLLECGIGNGDVLDMVNEAGIDIDYTGLDCTNAFVDHVRKKHPQANLDVGDMQDLGKFSDDEFTIAYTRHTLEHLPYYDKALRELARVSKERVIFILFHPLEENDRIIIKSKEYNLYNNYYGRKNFTKLIEELFDTASVTVVKSAKGGMDEVIMDCKL